MFCKVVAVAEAQVKRDGQVRAKGSPVHHATLGPLEERLESEAGPGVIGGIAGRAAGQQVRQGRTGRLLAAAFMIRVLVLRTLMPGARLEDVIAALAGDLALVPWSRPRRPASERAAGTGGGRWGRRHWRNCGPPCSARPAGAPGPGTGAPDRRQQQAAEGGIAGRDAAPGAGHAGEQGRVRVRRHRRRFRAVAVRAGLPPTCSHCRSLLAMPRGPAGTDKTAAEQRLLDRPGPAPAFRARAGSGCWTATITDRPARPAGRGHALPDQAEKRHPAAQDRGTLPDGSYRAELSGDGVTVRVRVIEYFVDVEGQEVPEMFCLVTDLMDDEEYPAPELAALYKWRWDGSETALREAKAPLRGAGPARGRCSAPAPRTSPGRSSRPGPPPSR